MKNITFFLVLLLISFNSFGQEQDDWSDDEWGDEWQDESPWTQSGFAELAWGTRLQSDHLFSDQKSLSDLRWHQDFDFTNDSLDFNFNFDAWIDDVNHELAFDLRELNFKFTLWNQTDVVLGRQISTWGTGDLLFINDMFPKDWQSFFSGRDDNYLKAPGDALRVTSFFEWVNIDVVITPTAAPDRFINGERFSLFSPWAQQQLGGAEIINPKNPNQTEYALRFFKNHNSKQYALYLYDGIEKSPLGIDLNFTPYFPEKRVFGASIQGGIGQGLFNLEAGYHQALEDKNGNNPLVPNSQWRLLLGYERELVAKLNWGLQFYFEQIEHHKSLIDNSLFEDFEPSKDRQVITNRLTYRALQDKLIYSLFVFYSPSDKDSYWRPSINYRYNDQWQLTFGANIFSGQEKHTFFGQFEDASNAYLRLKLSY